MCVRRWVSRYNNLANLIDSTIKSYIDKKSLEKSRTYFIDNFRKSTQDLQKGINSMLDSDIGLLAQVKVSIKVPDDIPDDKINNLRGSIYLKDCNDEVDLVIDAIISRLPSHDTDSINALLIVTKLTDLESLILKYSGNYVRDNIKINDHDLLFKESERAKIKEILNLKLRAYGRCISVLKIHLSGSPLKGINHDIENIRKTINIDIEGYGKIKIKTKTQIRIDDVRKYISSGKKNIDTWVFDNLKQVCNKILFRTTYLDLLLKVDDIEENIKDEMCEASSLIGCNIDLITAFVGLPHRELSKDFDVNVKQNYSTIIDDCNVTLSVICTTRIPDLESVKELINSGDSVKEKIEIGIKNTVQREMHKLHPNDFYSKFQYAENEESVIEILTPIITNDLKNLFGAEVSRIIFKQGNDDVQERFKHLNSKPEVAFGMKVSSLALGGGDVTFVGKFRFEMINSEGWNQFLRQNFSLDDIRQSIEDCLGSDLNLYPTEVLSITTHKQKHSLENRIYTIASDRVRKLYGVEISIFNISRGHTDLERRKIDAIQTVEEKEIDQFVDRRIAEIENSDRDAQHNNKKLELLYNEEKRLITQSESVFNSDKDSHFDDTDFDTDNFVVDDELKIVQDKIKKIKGKAKVSATSEELEHLMNANPKIEKAKSDDPFGEDVLTLSSNDRDNNILIKNLKSKSNRNTDKNT